MSKNYIKMNKNQNQLSLGNFCRCTKELAQNKAFANQTEIFYTLFDVTDVSDSTVNNYCIGYRTIGSEFRQKYIAYKNHVSVKTLYRKVNSIKMTLRDNKYKR